MALLLASLKGHCPLVKLFIGVGNLKPKLKCFFKPKLKPNFFYCIATLQGSKRSDAERYISRVESQRRECRIMSKYAQADWVDVNYDDA